MGRAELRLHRLHAHTRDTSREAHVLLAARRFHYGFVTVSLLHTLPVRLVQAVRRISTLL